MNVCVKCQAQFLPKKNGVTVLETVGNPPQSMRVWVADLLGCPVCGAETIANFCHEPVIERHERGFEETLGQIRERDKGRLYILHNPEFLVQTVKHETKYVRSYVNHRLRTTDR